MDNYYQPKSSKIKYKIHIVYIIDLITNSRGCTPEIIGGRLEDSGTKVEKKPIY